MFGIIIYVIDCLRADHVSCYGYHRRTTPNIDEIAKQGVKFTKAFAQSTYTLSSAASILTGAYPSVHGALNFSDKLSIGIHTLPEYLKDLNFRTVVLSGEDTFLSAKYGLTRGFDDQNLLKKAKARRSCYQARANEINEVFLPWIEENEDPFLALIWAFDAHTPYLTPPSERFFSGSNNPIIDSYDSEIRYIDEQIGVIIEKLKEFDLYDNVLLFILADHGDVFSEHYHFENSKIINSIISWNIPLLRDQIYRGGYQGHFLPPYDPLINVPLVVKFPKNQYSGRVVNEQVQLIDILPTIIDYLHINVPTWKRHWQGSSLIPLLNRNSNKTQKYVFSETRCGDAYVSIRSPEYKLIRIDPDFSISAIRENPFFSLLKFFLMERKKLVVSGSDEKQNLMSKMPGVVQKMEGELNRWEEKNRRLSRNFKQSRQRMTKEIEDRLKSLGYI